MKLLVDMNLSPGWVDRLRQHGFETVHWSTVGAATAPDDEILAWAREHQFVVVRDPCGDIRSDSQRRAGPNSRPAVGRNGEDRGDGDSHLPHGDRRGLAAID